MNTSIYINSNEAAQLLGVRKETLYAYVSRNWIMSYPGASSRERKFRRADVMRLLDKKAGARKPKQVANATLDWGLPVLESGLTLIENGDLLYRGVALAQLLSGASLEDVARLLWQCPPAYCFPSTVKLSSRWHRIARAMAGVSSYERTLTLLALGQSEVAFAAENDASAFDTGALLLQLVAAAALGQAPAGMPVHEQCAKAWNLDARGSNIVRTALVACADHELNASSFTARCIASTGATAHAAIVGALAALSGPLHGGFTERIEDMLDELSHAKSIKRTLSHRISDMGDLPGFGHRLYPDGDPRAVALLRLLPPNRKLRDIVNAAEALSGQKPSIDFALVAARRCLGLPRGSAFAIFAMGRTVGWIAHVLEQRQAGKLIRPRATYIGPRAPHVAATSGRIIRFGAARGPRGAKSIHGSTD